MRLAAAPVFEPGKKAGRPGARADPALQMTPDAAKGEAAHSDDWERPKLFIATVADIELVDTALKAEDLLWRLFHEDEVRVPAVRARWSPAANATAGRIAEACCGPMRRRSGRGSLTPTG